jgi:hypothetical protein
MRGKERLTPHQQIPKDAERFRKMRKDSERCGKIPKDAERFRKMRKDGYLYRAVALTDFQRTLLLSIILTAYVRLRSFFAAA